MVVLNGDAREDAANIGGLSRAAKKRAKKKQKKQSELPVVDHHHPPSSNNNEAKDQEKQTEKKRTALDYNLDSEKGRNKIQSKDTSRGKQYRKKAKLENKEKHRKGSKQEKKGYMEEDVDDDSSSDTSTALERQLVKDVPNNGKEDYNNEKDGKACPKDDEKNSNLLHELDDDEASEIEVKMKSPAKQGGILQPLPCTQLKDLLLLGDRNQTVPEPSSKKVPLEDTLLQEGQGAFAAMTVSERATAALAFLLHPAGLTVTQFYDNHWEKKPCVITQPTTTDEHSAHRHRFDGFLSLASLQQWTKTQHRGGAHVLYYGRDLNVTRYEKDSKGVKRRVTLDLQPAVHERSNRSKDSSESSSPSLVPVDQNLLWEQYHQQGCTIRLLCPQKHFDSVHALLSLLEQEWGCMVGANAYLTPPNQSQGFAPHYDDIEAFCLQLEGSKRWKVYAPLKKNERLPRVSSEDYVDDDLRGVEPFLDVILQPGDMLYMPRGWIHQAVTLPSGHPGSAGHSLHLTISTMQQWAWVDLMEILLPDAIASLAASESTSLRAGLPIRFLEYMGVMHDNNEQNLPEILRQQASKAAIPDDQQEDGNEESLKKERIAAAQEAFRAEAKRKIARIAQEANNLLDAACDEMGKRFISDRQPPALTRAEKDMTSQAESVQALRIQGDMLCRLVRPGVARLVLEDNKAVVYHCADNSRVFQEHALSPMEFEIDDAPAIEQLLTTIEPHWICVNDLFHDTMDDKIGVTQALYDEGILAVRP